MENPGIFGLFPPPPPVGRLETVHNAFFDRGLSLKYAICRYRHFADRVSRWLPLRRSAISMKPLRDVDAQGKLAQSTVEHCVDASPVVPNSLEESPPAIA